MRNNFPSTRASALIPRAAFAFAIISILGIGSRLDIFAQRNFSKIYPVRQSIELRLNNWSGQIEVQGCECSDIRMKITIDSKGTKVNPEMVNGVLMVDLGRDNPGVADVGDVNFLIRLPSNASLDLMTRVGNVKVSDIHGATVRARVTEGDINLLNVNTSSLIAEDKTGGIFFDGELQRNGSYKFSTFEGDITLRIPAYSTFHLEASAPNSRSIALGNFASAAMNSLGGGRKLSGTVGDGQATVNVMNFRGRISFLER